jgi:hypothetical protein
MKKKMGRPKTPQSVARVPGISVRLTKDERKTIDAAIRQSGLSQSDWARKGLIYVASNGIALP